MARYHEDQIGKAQRVAGYVLSVLFSIQILLAGVMKLMQAPPVVENMSNVPNWGDKILFIGLLEVVLLAVYWIPRTTKFGFYLLCSFMGGVIVAEVASGQQPVVGIATTVLLYAGTIMRNPSYIN